MTTTEELKICFALQKEIDGKLDELIKRFKAIIEANRNRRIIAEIDGELCELVRGGAEQQLVNSASKYGGFYADYRIVDLGKPLK